MAAPAFGAVGLAFGYGSALALVGAATVAFGEVAHWTALIPAMLAALVLLAALCGRSGLLGGRVVGAIVLGLSVLALAGTLSALPLLPAALAGGDAVRNAAAVFARSATAAASLAFVGAMAVLMLRHQRRQP